MTATDIRISNPTAPASDAQKSFALSLYHRAYPTADPEAANAFHEMLHSATKQEASDAITALKAKVTVVAAEQITRTAAAPLTKGVYVNAAGDVVKVQANRQTGNLYGKVWTPIGGRRLVESGDVVRFEFVYTPGSIRGLTEADRMTHDAAIAFGVKYAICCNCGRSLKDAESVEAGIGPVCAKSFR